MKLFDKLLDLLYPPRCAFCHRLLRNGGEGVCKDCLTKLPYTGDCSAQTGLKHIKSCVSPLYYENNVRESLHRFKFGQRTGYAGIYAGFMVKSIDENEISCDIITWAPVSRQRLRSRGYDQSELLGRELSARLGTACMRLLVKQRHTPPQSRTKNAAQRRENVKGAYRCCDSEATRGKKVLLVDDIVTSGSTLSECARMLKEAGAAEVSAVTVARKR